MNKLTLDEIHVAEVHSEYIDRLIHDNHYLDTIPAGAKHRYIITGGITHGVIGGALWGRPVARLEDQENTLELTRFWTEEYTPKNTESYALSRMICDINDKGKYDRLIAYASTGKDHDGGIYKATNWELVGRTDGYGGDGWENRNGRVNVDPSPKLKFEYQLK